MKSLNPSPCRHPSNFVKVEMLILGSSNITYIHFNGWSLPKHISPNCPSFSLSCLPIHILYHISFIMCIHCSARYGGNRKNRDYDPVNYPGPPDNKDIRRMSSSRRREKLKACKSVYLHGLKPVSQYFCMDSSL